jgi:putative flippase GtrA
MANAFVAGRGAPEILRYGLNGLAATAVHYSVLVAGFGFLKIPSAGLANLIAAACGIAVSFFGNRIFAVFHTGFLAIWTDVYALNYSVGFLFATCFQTVSSYFGNKYLVFFR